MLVQKYFDSTGNSQGASATLSNNPTFNTNWPSSNATFFCLNTPIQGIAQNQRVGDTIHMTSLQIRGMLDNTGGTQVQCVRLMVVYDTQPGNSVSPQLSDIFQAAPVSGSIQTTALNRMVARSRFRVVCNHEFMMSTQTTNPTTSRCVTINCKLNLNTQFQGSSSTYGQFSDILTGALYLLVFAGASVAAMPVFQMNVNRIRFIDV